MAPTRWSAVAGRIRSPPTTASETKSWIAGPAPTAPRPSPATRSTRGRSAAEQARLGLEAFLADQGDEAAGADHRRRDLVVNAAVLGEHVGATGRDRGDQPAARRE